MTFRQRCLDGLKKHHKRLTANGRPPAVVLRKQPTNRILELNIERVTVGMGGELIINDERLPDDNYWNRKEANRQGILETEGIEVETIGTEVFGDIRMATDDEEASTGSEENVETSRESDEQNIVVVDGEENADIIIEVEEIGEAGVEEEEEDDDDDDEDEGIAIVKEGNGPFKLRPYVDDEEPSTSFAPEELPFSCIHCTERFKVKKEYDSHMERHEFFEILILSAFDFYRCSLCLAIFLDFEGYKQHTIHRIGCIEFDPLVDDDPSNCVDGVDQSIIRLFSAHPIARTQFIQCDVCSLKFADADTFRTHFDDSHSYGLFANAMPEYYLQPHCQHYCGVCGMSQRNLPSTLLHVFYHQMMFECWGANCTARFPNFSELYEHVMKSHQIPNIDSVCPYCQYAAKTSQNMYEHKKKFCPKRDIRCHFCREFLLFVSENVDRFCWTLSNLNDLSEFCCCCLSMVAKLFYRESTMRVHERTHRQEKKYVCEDCNKSFIQKNDLINHIR